MEEEEETSLIIRELPTEPREFIFVYRGQPVVQIPRNITRLQVDSSVRIIEPDAFKSCGLRNHLVIPSTVKVIEKTSFMGCAQLTHVCLQQGLQSIGMGAFLKCFQLVEVQLPNTGLTEIATATFTNCKSLVAIKIPKTVKYIRPQAFVNCKSLVAVTFCKDGLLKRIQLGAFRGCSSLSAISLPPSLEVVGRNVFVRCNSLLCVEIPSKSNIEMLSLNECASLVNLSIPKVCFELALEGCPIPENKHKCLRDRFENLPIHNLCYQLSMTTKEQVVQAISDNVANDDESLWKDAFDMTPFHILATSASLHPDLLEWLLFKYPVNILLHKDWYGNTMMDYLLKHRSPRAVPLVQRVLRRVVLDTVSSWYPKSDWGSNLKMLVDAIPMTSDLNERRQCVQDFFGQVGHCGRIEITSIMELAVWKMKLMYEKKTMENVVVNRNSCRYQSDGAEIVMEHVIGYLWETEPTFHTGLSLFPLCSSSSINE